MVGCDLCDEWYHFSCIGITHLNDDASFVCIRCKIMESFKHSAKSISSVVDTWKNPEDIQKASLIRAQKRAKRISKEEDCIKKLEIELESLLSEKSISYLSDFISIYK